MEEFHDPQTIEDVWLRAGKKFDVLEFCNYGDFESFIITMSYVDAHCRTIADQRLVSHLIGRLRHNPGSG